jgi:hypothetical protein
MTWIKLDDGFISHPKTLELSHKSIVLHIAGLTYCATQLTNGKIPKTAVPMVLAQARVSKSSLDPLLAVGMWRDQGDHLLIHDYLTYQESRETVLARREKWAGKKRHQREMSPGDSTGDTPGDSTGESHAPVPSRPVPSSNSTYENNSHHQHGVEATTEQSTVDTIADAIARWRTRDTTIRNPTKYIAAARANILNEHGDRIRELIAAFPLAPVDSIVHAVETGDSRNLAMFTDEPSSNSNVLEMPARRLTPAERAETLRANGVTRERLISKPEPA